VYSSKNNGNGWEKKAVKQIFLLFQAMALEIGRNTEAFLISLPLPPLVKLETPFYFNNSTRVLS